MTLQEIWDEQTEYARLLALALAACTEPPGSPVHEDFDAARLGSMATRHWNGLQFVEREWVTKHTEYRDDETESQLTNSLN